MATQLEDLTELFKKQIGVKETPVNNVIYNTHYYGHEVSGAEYPWCCAFIWDVFRMAGLSQLFCGGQKTAYCPFVVNYAKQNKQWVTDSFRHGDLLLYDWNGDGVADHIGFVVEWSGGKGLVIEGNTGGSGGFARGMIETLHQKALSLKGYVDVFDEEKNLWDGNISPQI